MKSFLKVTILLLATLQSLNSYAWNALGHMVVANIAYERLHPEVRVKVDKMVTDLAKEYPEIKSFYQIGPWPDTLRSQKIETFTHWHYIDLPFSDDGTPLKNTVDTDNIIWAINQIKPIVQNAKANSFERARFLAFLTHFVGDIHQPLHTVGRISAAHPNGDAGGNLFYIKDPVVKTKSITLHKLWDDGFGILSVEWSPNNVASLSELITTLYPEQYFETKINDLSPETWGNEGLALSSTFVYTIPENQVPNENYLVSGKEIIKQQIALAGYRLANVLNVLLKT